MRLLNSLLFWAVIASATSAQTPYATAIWTDFDGFWTSSGSSLNPIKPDSAHMLLAFTVEGTTYSTGVNDALLTSNSVAFTEARFRALNFAASMDLTGAHWQMGAMADGNASAAAGDVPITVNGTTANLQFSSDATVRNSEARRLLADGLKGLNLGTGVVNFPDQTVNIDFPASGLASGYNDDEPELLITQMAGPNSVVFDSIAMTDASGTILGNWVTLVFHPQGANDVADWTVDVRNSVSGAAINTNIDRKIQMIGLDFSDFGLTAAQVPQVAKVRHAFGSQSDFAFMAYNERSFVDCVAAAVTLSSVTPVAATSPVAFDGEMVPSISGGTAPYSLRQVGTSSRIPNTDWDEFRPGVYNVEVVDDLNCVSVASKRVMIPHVRCNAPS